MSTTNELKHGNLSDLKYGDLCIVITRQGAFHEGLYVGRFGGFTIWRNLYFDSAVTIPRAIREYEIEVVGIVCPNSPVLTESEYHEALLKLLSL